MEVPEPQGLQAPPAPPAPPAPQGREGPPAPGSPPDYPRGTRLLVGSVVSFLVASLLYGVETVIQLVFFATICTIGIGLALILVACYLVGWVILALWKAITRRGPASQAS
jgi:ABC-type dipeptide/oligopeptide/nickel transport system permease subunit